MELHSSRTEAPVMRQLFIWQGWLGARCPLWWYFEDLRIGQAWVGRVGRVGGVEGDRCPL